MGISSQVAAHLSINLLADDTSRVKLSNVDDDPCSDYVNASYIPVSELPAHHAQDEADDGYTGHATPSKPPYCSPYKQVARFKRPCPFAIKYRLLPSIVVFTTAMVRCNSHQPRMHVFKDCFLSVALR